MGKSGKNIPPLHVGNAGTGGKRGVAAWEHGAAYWMCGTGSVVGAEPSRSRAVAVRMHYAPRDRASAPSIAQNGGTEPLRSRRPKLRYQFSYA